MTTVTDLLARFGSPLYVYRLDGVSAALADLRGTLPRPSTVLYSVKANPHPDLARHLRQGGCGAEVSSPGELRAATDAGFAGADCFYTGPAKTREEIATAVLAGVRRFSVESLADLRRVADVSAGHGTTADCLIRVNTRFGGPSGLRMSGTGSQFGVPLADLIDDPGWTERPPGARVVGAHFFPVSNAHDEDALLAEFLGSLRAAARLRDEAGLPMSVVDLGGGFAAPYAAPGRRPRYPRLREALEAGLDTYLPGWRTGSPEIIFESGRYLVAECGGLVCTVTEVKRVGEKNFVLLDSGINHLGGMSGLGRFLRPAAVPRSVTPAPGDPARRSTVVGPLCTPADVLGADVEVGAVTAGAPVVVENVGAYGLTASLLAFLSRPVPTEVVLRDGHVVSASRIGLGRAPVEPELPGWTVDGEGHHEG